MSVIQDGPIGPWPRRFNIVRQYPAVVIVAALVAVFSIIDARFLTLKNLENIGMQASFLLVLALAQTVVLIGRGFDLSMGNAVSLISVASALAMTGAVGAGSSDGVAVLMGIGVAAAIGIGIGGIMGLFSGIFGANSFIISLGVMNACYGLAAIISGGRPVFNVPLEFVSLLGSGTVMKIPAPIFISVVVCLVLHVLLSRTVYGRLLYMVGSNPRATYIAGHNPRTIIAASFVIAGALVALSALLLTARTGTGEPNVGANLLLQAIAAAVIGGVSLQGGRGAVWQAVFGTLTITILSNILNLQQVSGYVQTVFLGLVIIIALWLERQRNG